MIEDFATMKIVGLFGLFIVLVLLAIVVGIRDARRRKLEHQRRVEKQVEILKRAQAEMEQRRQQEAQAGAATVSADGFRPSEFVVGQGRTPDQGTSSADARASRQERRMDDFGTPSAA